MANGSTPVYEKIGPVTYDITTTRTILDYDSAAGELTYNSVKSFACSADTAVPCDTEVSQLNIARPKSSVPPAPPSPASWTSQGRLHRRYARSRPRVHARWCPNGRSHVQQPRRNHGCT